MCCYINIPYQTVYCSYKYLHWNNLNAENDKTYYNAHEPINFSSQISIEKKEIYIAIIYQLFLSVALMLFTLPP